MRYEIQMTAVFKAWVGKLKDPRGLRAIPGRIDQMAGGNFGKHRSVGGRVSELKIDVGPGYRVYYTIRKQRVVLLLCGGDKGSQKGDIAKAQGLARELEED